MKTNSTSITRVVALLLAIVMAMGLAACSAGEPTLENDSHTGKTDHVTIVDPDTGETIDIPSPEAGSKPWIDWGGWANTSKDNKDDKDSGSTKDDDHVPGTPRQSKPIKRWYKNLGELTTLTMSVKTPSKPDTKDTKMDNSYGTVDWSTAANGYVTFTAKGQTREFILEGPNGSTGLFTVDKGDTIKAALTDGTGKYQYAIANLTADGKSYRVQYKNSFQVKSIDSDLAPYLVSTPYGDYENAPNAVAKADELWDSKKDQLANIKAITDWVDGLKYDKSLKTGTLDVYANPDKVIEVGGGVCNEMSKTLVAMLRSQGIPAYLQCGLDHKGQVHAWVMAWLEYSSETKNGTTYSTGTWILIEAVGPGVQPKSLADKNYTPSEYRG